MRILLEPSNIASAALVIALCTFNWLVKSTGNSFFVSVPLFASLLLVASSLLSLKKNRPKLSAKLFLLGASCAIFDFLVALFVLKMMHSNSIVVVLSAVSAGMCFVNMLYSRNYSKMLSCVFINLVLLSYTTTMERFEVVGCIVDPDDISTKIVPVCILCSIHLMYLVPLRIGLSVEYNKEEHANVHLSLSLVLFLVCAGKTLLSLSAFGEELAAIGKSVSSAVAFLAGFALLGLFYVTAVLFRKKLRYAVFARAYQICISTACILYLFDPPDFIFAKNALENEFFVFYLPLFAASLFLFVTPEGLGEISRSAIFDDFRIPTILAYYGHTTQN